MDSHLCIDPIKLLVHNVSHADLCVCLQLVHSQTHDSEIIARPRSSRFGYVCKELIQVIDKGTKFRGISFENQINNYSSYQSSPLSTPKQLQYFGIEFINPPSICSWQDFHVKDRYYNINNSTSSPSPTIVITKVFFPLISVILPKWISLHERQVLSTPEQGGYPCLSAKKFESSDSDQTVNGNNQDSDDMYTSSHDMSIHGSGNINSSINGSLTETGTDNIEHENKSENSPQSVEMSPSSTPTVAIHNNNGIETNTNRSRNQGVRILHTGRTISFSFLCLFISGLCCNTYTLMQLIEYKRYYLFDCKILGFLHACPNEYI